MNHIKYIVKEGYFSYHAVVICELSTARSKQEFLSTQSTVSLSQLICSGLERIFVILIYVLNLHLALVRWSIFTTGLCSSLLGKHTPVQSRHATARVRPPWLNDDIKKARQDS